MWITSSGVINRLRNISENQTVTPYKYYTHIQSGPVTVMKGVPQGFVLGLLPFVIYKQRLGQARTLQVPSVCR